MTFDQGVPFGKIKRGPKPKIDWNDMNVGESIWVDGDEAGKSALMRAYRYGKQATHNVWQCQDGTVLDPPEGTDPRELIALINHREGFWRPIARKRFHGEHDREKGGWRIWRVEDVPISERDYYEVPAFPGVKFLRD